MDDYSEGYDAGFADGAQEVEGGSIGLVAVCAFMFLLGILAGYFVRMLL